MLLQQLTNLNPREFHNKYEVQVDGHEHGGLHRILLTDKPVALGSGERDAAAAAV